MTFKRCCAIMLIVPWAALAPANGLCGDAEPPSLNPKKVLDTLDLSKPGLEIVRLKAEEGDRTGALAALLAYYREEAQRVAASSPRGSPVRK